MIRRKISHNFYLTTGKFDKSNDYDQYDLLTIRTFKTIFFILLAARFKTSFQTHIVDLIDLDHEVKLVVVTDKQIFQNITTIINSCFNYKRNYRFHCVKSAKRDRQDF